MWPPYYVSILCSHNLQYLANTIFQCYNIHMHTQTHRLHTCIITLWEHITWNVWVEKTTTDNRIVLVSDRAPSHTISTSYKASSPGNESVIRPQGYQCNSAHKQQVVPAYRKLRGHHHSQQTHLHSTYAKYKHNKKGVSQLAETYKARFSIYQLQWQKGEFCQRF